MKKTILLIAISLGFIFLTAQDCTGPTAYSSLDINNIRAGLMNGGDMWWDGSSEARYEYPKLPATATPKNLAFVNGLWLSGLDSSGDLKLAAMTYRNSGFDFWPGPIDYLNPTIGLSECNKWDKFFEIYKTDVQTHVNNINTLSLPLSISSIDSNIKEWPAKGNAYLLSTYSMDIIHDLAPFNDSNGNGIYDPENGDYPLIKGDQSLFWVINDLGNAHASGGSPLGVEIQCMAYSYVTTDDLNNSTFYDYKIIKRTNGNLHDFYFSQFIDADIGIASDDFIGCDTVKNYGFTYNGNSVDFQYGANSPIFVNQFINFNLSSFMYYNNGSCLSCEPNVPQHYRGYQLAQWKDGSHLTYGENGLTPTNPPTNYVYPSNPATGAGWSECASTDNPNGSTPADRRMLMTSGPYDLIQNTPLEFTVATIVVHPNSSNNCAEKDSITPIVCLVDTFLDTVINNTYFVSAILGITNFQDLASFVELFPNPATDKITLKLNNKFELTNLSIYDIKGSKMKFEINGKTIDIKDFSKGMYTMKLYSENINKIVVKKFLVE